MGAHHPCREWGQGRKSTARRPGPPEYRESMGSWLLAPPSHCKHSTQAQVTALSVLYSDPAASYSSRAMTGTKNTGVSWLGTHQKQSFWLKVWSASQHSSLWLSVKGLPGALKVEQWYRR